MPYLALFAWSFLAATVLPLGSEPAVILMIRQDHSFFAVVIVATVGNYLGACTARYGAPALVFSWVPIIGDAIVAAAGVARLRFWPFSIWTVVGKVVRYALVAWGAKALIA